MMNFNPARITISRALLREVMERHGFERFATEWWHYDFRGWERFELMDLLLDEEP